MAKKKRIPKLSSMDKAFATAANFPNKSPEKFKEYLIYMRNNQKEIIKRLSLNSFWDVSKPNEDSLNFFSLKNDPLLVAGRYRDLMLEFWWRKKKCFLFSEDTLSFIEEAFHSEAMTYNATAMFVDLCKEPIYIEFPQSAPIKGVFCGCRPVPSDKVAEYDENPLLILLPVGEDNAYVSMTQVGDTRIKELIESANRDEKMSIDFAYKAIFYLSYLTQKLDAPGNVLIPYPKQNCECYRVEPIPFQDWGPDFESPEDWMRIGFCFMFKYLSRENMRTAFSRELSLHPEFDSDPYVDGGEDSDEHIKHLLKRMILNWEETRTIYQYSKDTSELLVNKNLLTMQGKGILRSQFRYLPTPVVALYLKELNAIFVATTCNVGLRDEQGLLSMLVYKSEATIRLTHLNTPYVPPSSDNTIAVEEEDVFVRSLCALSHLLSVLESNTIKKMNIDLLSRGNPDLQALVPIIEKAPSNRKGRQRESGQDSLRVGAAIYDIPLNLFTITPAGIKKVSRKEIEKITRWTMVPHVRRGHYHHYWVGKGSERHLETRWLESMKINCKDGISPTPVVKELK